MRQIKFRGIFKVGDNDYYSEDEKNYIESKQHEILSISIGSHCTIAYQDTVMAVFEMQCSNYDLLQFTGLTDKNGKEIYEGDIIKEKESDYSNEYRLYRVYWCDDNMQYWMSDDDTGDSFPLIELEIDYSIVIGSIQDNPELLDC